MLFRAFVFVVGERLLAEASIHRQHDATRTKNKKGSVERQANNWKHQRGGTIIGGEEVPGSVSCQLWSHRIAITMWTGDNGGG